MLHLLFESGDGNSELKGRRFPLGKNIYAHLKETLDNYKGDKSVEGYKRLVNIINMNDNEGGILYNEMKRIKNFFDNYNGSKDSVNFILNGGEPMENWVRNTLNTAIETVKGFKQAKAMGGLNNSFRKEHTKDRIVKPPKETKIKMSDINKNLLNVAGSGFKITKPNKVKSSVNEGKTFYIIEEQQKQLLNEITIRDKYEKEKERTKWSNPRDFQRICQSDPTYNREKDIVGKYTNWLLLRLNDLSDLERVRVPLEWYADGMKKGILQRQGINPDINTYKSVDEFISAMESVMKSGDEPMQSASEMNNREKFAGQFKVIGQSRYWEVISPLTFEAERWFGRKTEWCTVANEGYFDRYGGYEGELFIFYPKNGELDTRIQVHFGSNSFFDVNDDGYHNIAEALEAYNTDEDAIIDGVNLANKLWNLGLRYIKLEDAPELLAQGVDPKDIFHAVGEFKEGFACVQLKGKENYINEENQLLSSWWFDEVWDFENGFGIVSLDDEQNFINTNGQIISDQWFDTVWSFKNGFAMVSLDGVQNFIDTKGQILSSQWFDDMDSFSEGFAKVELNDKWNFIDTEGQLVSPQWFDEVNNFYDDIARVRVTDKWNFINSNGQIMSPQWFDWLGMFYYGIGVVELNGKGNFINTNGEILSSQWFDKLSGFENGMGAVMLNGKTNFITKDMKFLSLQWFDGLTRFYNGLGGVKLNNKWNLINTEGQIVSPQWFDEVETSYSRLPKVRINDKWNLTNMEGQLLSRQWFDNVYSFNDGFAVVNLNSKWNFINKEGQILYKPNEEDQWFDYVRDFNEGYAWVELNDTGYRLRSDGVLCDYRTLQPIPELNESKVNKRTFYITNEQISRISLLNEDNEKLELFNEYELNYNKYQYLLRKPINKLTLDEITYLYAIHWIQDNPGLTLRLYDWELDNYIEKIKRTEGKLLTAAHEYFKNLKFPLKVYRGMRPSENINNLSGKKRSLSWTTDSNIYSNEKSKFKHCDRIVEAEITPDMVQNEWSIVNFMLYSAKHYIDPDNNGYGEYELSLKPRFKYEKLDNLKQFR